MPSQESKRAYVKTEHVPVTPTATDNSDEDGGPNKRPKRDAAFRASDSISAQTDFFRASEHAAINMLSPGGGREPPATRPAAAEAAPLSASSSGYEPRTVPSTQSFRDVPALPTSQYREDEPFVPQFYPPGYNLKWAEQRTRVFGIEHVPVLHPTMDQFDDPLSYIESISEIGRRYGAVKIVPPAGWEPPCAIDPNVRSSGQTCG